jgi:hypothetical protein
MLFGTFFGIQLSHGKNHVAITGIAGISGMKMSTSTVLALNSLGLRPPILAH